MRPRSYDIYILGEVFSEKTYTPLVPPAREPRVVADLGAHIGAFTLAAAWKWRDAKIVAVEMEKGNHSLLVQNLRRNALRSRVTPVLAAVWDGNGAVTIHRHPINSGMHRATRSTGRDEVSALTLDELFRQAKIDSVDVLKMDIEGTERTILLGPQLSTLASRVAYLMAEVHPGVSFLDAAEAVRSAGFQVIVKAQSFRRSVILHAVNTRFHAA